MSTEGQHAHAFMLQTLRRDDQTLGRTQNQPQPLQGQNTTMCAKFNATALNSRQYSQKLELQHAACAKTGIEVNFFVKYLHYEKHREVPTFA